MSKVKQQSLSWVDKAFKYVGLREVKGSKHNPTIVDWLKRLGAWWKDDETAWCGVFVAHCLTAVGRGSIPKHWYRALEYLNWGSVLDKPAYGSVAALKRKGGGHVFFVVGVTEKGDIVGLGGNQGDEVNLRVFARSEIEGYRWPPHANGVLSMPYPERYNLPVYDSKSLKVVGSMA